MESAGSRRALCVLLSIACVSLVAFAWLLLGRGSTPETPATKAPIAPAPLSPAAPAPIPAPEASGGPSPEAPAAAAAPRARGFAQAPVPVPWSEAPPSLRGVKGLVRDALTRAPIDGAWLVWRLPSAEVAERVLGDPAFRDPRFSMITGADGTFAVERLPDDLPVSATLYAVAAGYGYGALVVGARRQLVFDLVAMGTLEVEVVGAARAEATLSVRPQGWAREPIAQSVPESGAARFPHLPPGTCDVLLNGAPAAQAQVRAGQVVRVSVGAEPGERVTGTLGGASGNLADAQLVFVERDRFSRHEVSTDAGGNFEARVPRGRYAVFWSDGMSERRVGELSAPGGGVAHLDADPASSERVELRLTRSGRPLVASDLGLVSLEGCGSLIALEAAEPGLYRARAAGGRYLLFEGSRAWGEVAVPGSAALALEPRRVEVRWRLPRLEPWEVIRGEVSVLPTALSARPDLRARFLKATQQRFRASSAAPALGLLLGAPGPYEVVGLSDVGPFRAILPEGAAQVDVELSP